MSECQPDDQSGFFLPHHAVVKESSLTTATRVVFDGSAQTTTGISLNDTLLIGPTVQDDLFSITLRFRLHVYVLTGDIEKMYRCTYVHPDDRKFQKILMRFSPKSPIKHFKLNTVTYGTSCASHLAIRALIQLAHDMGIKFPLALIILLRDFYVDNMITGAKTLAQLEKIRDELLQVMKSGGLNLRQLASNQPSLVMNLKNPNNDNLLCLDLDETIKTLGISWNANSDSIVYKVNIDTISNSITKRVMLSQILRLFDPLGLLGPVLTKAKLVMQNLWKLKTHWDESVPLETHTLWTTFYSQLPSLENISFDRKVVIDDYTSLQIHGFCDASELAYGASIYIRSKNQRGDVQTRLLCSKAQVAPLKTITLPRLELCAATLLANLYNSVNQALSNFTFDKVTLWSDSTIVLHWIKTESRDLMTFVGNRVSEIQKLTNSCTWYHVNSDQNPADMLSRGYSPLEFCNQLSFWQNGPAWLNLPETDWPIRELEDIEIPERRQRAKVILTSVTPVITPFYEKYSTLRKTLRVLAYCLRFICKFLKSSPKFIKNAHVHMQNDSALLKPDQLTSSLHELIKQVQFNTFKSEIALLKKVQPVTGHLASLSLFLDQEGIIRVGGRLKHSDLTFNQKHPMLLPAKHHVTKLIINHEHERHYHAGAQATLGATRQYVWIINGRNSVKNILRKCTTCFSFKPTTPSCIMGNLPKPRIIFKRPFLQTGVDLCGPFYIKEKRHRNRNQIKVYLSVFVCFATRAIHIEIVEDLTTEAFMSCLRRFIGRRSCPSDMYSDNATNFSGTRNELDRINAFLDSARSEIMEKSASHRIVWHFAPPRSPHFGGLYEAAVKSLKHHLYRAIGNTLLSYEALHTLTVEIEMILNSRPITPLSSDPNDLQALTPGHFLIGDSMTNLPEFDFRDVPSGRLSSWEHAQQLKQHFWIRWKKEYLHQLNTKAKWHTSSAMDIKIGQIVIVHDDNLPVNKWKLGRIVKTHPDAEGRIRVVTIKTSTGEYKRSIKKISPLPIE